ncbi:mannose-6-phosphate isomerase, class I [Falsarthrobacter nasiphocae]|uniref:mannose-6-phosphate isomerase n=1 Tax=Falsarthrobacter nasiphocae TaxID=189863 RepID=A0AAE3YFA2_9MICC|nr:mannose-6-phosphate isomerase, class I [Falsarthrobacter nasiphocae]MDR6891632.1 mannose-6-phosphate isomerase [Falsarthrobacter nasiphocae]
MRLLRNPVRPYPWGSRTAIPELLGEEPTGEPQAEMWIGAHPASPSTVEVHGREVPLTEYIAERPSERIGADAQQRFGGLPFLVKLLAADAPLSLQVHPSIEQAKAGFAAEEAAGVPLDAPHRNYKDANHKPEMIVALTDFEALSGFRAPSQTLGLVEALAPLAAGSPSAEGLLSELAGALRADDEGEALRAAFTLALTDPRSPGAVDLLAAALRSADLEAGPLAAWTAELRTVLGLHEAYPGDPGVLVALLVNVVRLAPGEALFLGAGNLHAYLKGFGVEVMATSDNVLRGGLTPKHVDIDELMKTLSFQALPAPRCEPETAEFSAGRREVFAPPFDEFSVERFTFTVDGAVTGKTRGAAVVVVTEGTATVEGTALSPGHAGFVSADDAAPVIAATAGTVVFLVTGAA